MAPAYSLAATLGFIVAIDGMGVHAPAVMIVSFIPMLLIASAYNYMNRADPDCGTSFTWVTRAMGPRSGWITGWAIVVADVVVMATLAYIAGKYTFLLFDWDSAAHSLLAVSIVAAIWIAVMTWICYVGIELSAATQRDPARRSRSSRWRCSRSWRWSRSTRAGHRTRRCTSASTGSPRSASRAARAH